MQQPNTPDQRHGNNALNDVPAPVYLLAYARNKLYSIMTEYCV